TAEDIVSVVFNPVGNGNATSEFEVNVSNMHFTNSLFVEKPGAVFYPAYPNPFTGKTNLDLILTQDSEVKVEVLNSYGQTIEVVMNKPLTSGNHEIEWMPANLNPGIYMIKISVGEETYTTKVIYKN
ncbi:MAG: T9SS type A sorting domain-containing protein, partial [Bacteroidota bacterium]